MGKIDEAKEILRVLGLPQAQQNEISAYTLLALCGIREEDTWLSASRRSLGITKGIMQFITQNYNKEYAPNTRETFRRQVLHYFNQAGIVDYNPDNPSLPTNSPHAHYAISEDVLSVIKYYGAERWETVVRRFLTANETLESKYSRKREMEMIPVDMGNGLIYHLSPGKHNEVQVAVINEFLPRFAPGSKCIYLGDTAKKNLHIDHDVFNKLNITISDHDKLPDIVLYNEEKKWIFLVEVVTSHGPMNPKRVTELKEMFSGCPFGIIFVTAFPSYDEFRKHAKDIAWETEVWLYERPDHLIHYNGDRFLGPR
ncbi:BsuBI/PstI family type II restriction endonuclease [Desulfotomaculum copahuensis]|uniref:Restriction endonuclease n=1 Tax=Desulfotomaculum copahuensis TaxID=1838280 RepID=A0A1B7LGF3_9FIRM|nr:BsuBI/PstI family type II restriction endonuclease [Desulfotomaculum copahuensis]OAT84766.1 restriction endonuclease [Desulfotomaculum copahuensis]